jgi:hypothetical protein
MAQITTSTGDHHTHDRVDLAYRSSAVKGGFLGGLYAGLGAGLIACLISGATGGGFAVPFRLTAASVMGPFALVAGPGAVALGAALYLAVSMLWGYVFATFVSRSTAWGAALWGGLLFGVAVWAIETFIGLPIVNAVKESRVAMMPGSWFLENLLFGLLLYRTPHFKRRYGEPTIRLLQGSRREAVRR